MISSYPILASDSKRFESLQKLSAWGSNPAVASFFSSQTQPRSQRPPASSSFKSWNFSWYFFHISLNVVLSNPWNVLASFALSAPAAARTPGDIMMQAPTLWNCFSLLYIISFIWKHNQSRDTIPASSLYRISRVDIGLGDYDHSWCDRNWLRIKSEQTQLARILKKRSENKMVFKKKGISEFRLITIAPERLRNIGACIGYIGACTVSKSFGEHQRCF